MQRYKQRNFYIQDLANGLKRLYSYETCIGYQYFDDVFYTPRKYSRTTSKQLTQYAGENALKRYFLPNNDLCENFWNKSLYNIIDELNFVKSQNV